MTRCATTRGRPSWFVTSDGSPLPQWSREAHHWLSEMMAGVCANRLPTVLSNPVRLCSCDGFPGHLRVMEGKSGMGRANGRGIIVGGAAVKAASERDLQSPRQKLRMLRLFRSFGESGCRSVRLL